MSRIVVSYGGGTNSMTKPSAPLLQRIDEACERISHMCHEGRPPKMSIPVQDSDDDIFITETLRECRDLLCASPQVPPREDALHTAVCNAVTLMQRGANFDASQVLRQSLIDYADAALPRAAGADNVNARPGASLGNQPEGKMGHKDKANSVKLPNGLGRLKYPGPYLDGARATGMEVAYVHQLVGPEQALYRPGPPNAVINQVLAANDPWDTVKDALANGSYVPSAEVRNVAAAYNAWQLANAHHPD